MSEKTAVYKIRFIIKHNRSGDQVFKCLIDPILEPGYPKGRWSDYIQDLTVSIDGTPCFYLMMGENTPRYFYVSFVFVEEVTEGQTMRISWVDNYGKKAGYEIVLKRDKRGGLSSRSSKMKRFISAI